MKKVVLRQANPLFLREEHLEQINLGAEDYLARLDRLRARMGRDGVDACVVYGDREHFANIEYLCGYDCRFEEGVFVVPAQGVPTLLVGNEGMALSYAVPFEIRRVYYRNFSLQGQPRRAEENLASILRQAGAACGARVGLIGFKYFDARYDAPDPDQTYDVPHYIVEACRAACTPGRVFNYTAALTGLADGQRLRVYSAKEIAQAEAAAARSTNVVLRLLKNLKPGLCEYELSQRAQVGFAPMTMWPLVNFGAQSVRIGIRSPQDDVRLALGDVCGLCYGVRGSLTSRVGVAAYDQASMKPGLGDKLFSFYGKFFQAMCAWYEALRIGVTGHQLHHAVHDLIGAAQYNVELNCGHYTGRDEWVNALSFDKSTYTVPDGAYMQVDIIASNPDPVRTAICEDPVLVAGEQLRAELEREYPQVYARVMARRQAMRDTLGIDLAPEVLPLSNLNAAMFPFMLDLNTVFALQEA